MLWSVFIPDRGSNKCSICNDSFDSASLKACRRLWVIQEIILAPASIFICGHSALKASDVLRVSVWLNHKAPVLPYRLRECQGRHNATDIAYIAAVSGSFERGTTQNISLRYLLALSTRFDTSEPRDHIYGILGLLRSSASASSPHFHLIAPSYSRPVAQVYREAITFSLLETVVDNLEERISSRRR